MAKAKILIVDDELQVRKVLCRTLEKNDFEIKTAPDGRKALELIGKEKFDLVLLDLRMPEMDGVDVLRSARELSKEFPVYFMTGFKDDFASKLKELDDDGIGYEILVKPLHGEQLLTVIYSLIKDKTQENMHYEINFYKVGQNTALMNKFGAFQEYLRQETGSQFKFEVIDCLENSELAEKANILATPTIIKVSPPPITKVIGDISDFKKISSYLGIL